MPIGGDALKATNKIGKFALKNADDIGIYAEILSFSNKNFPDAVKQLGKNDEFVLATKKVSELSEKKITKKQYQEMLKSWTEAGVEELLGSTSITDKRIYKPSPKHDPISGWGSPDPIPDIEIGQKLLDTAYSSLKNKQLYNIYNNQLIKFQPDSVDGWHAYLVENPAKEVPADVLRKMLEDKKITKVQYKDFIKNSKR